MDAIERDFYEERRRKWRRSAFWRGFFGAILLIVIAVAGLAFLGLEPVREHVARIEVAGIITDNPARDEMLGELAGNDAVRALIVRVNSPGGSTAGSEALHAALRDVAAEKPIVAVMGETAASGGYIAAIAADHIVARGNTLTGSIGVILEYPDVTELMARIGVEMDLVRSSPLKAEPSPFRETNPAARAVSEAMVEDAYRWFRDLVGERRALAGGDLASVADGSVFTGRMALEAGLIDEIGGEREALDWLELREAGLSDLPVRDWEPEEELSGIASILGRIGSTGGILGGISSLKAGKLYSIGP